MGHSHGRENYFFLQCVNRHLYICRTWTITSILCYVDRRGENENYMKMT